MHIPDGFLSPEVCAGTALISAAAIGYSVHRMKDTLGDRTVPMTGMIASLIFAGQMVNFPVGTGVSGHLLGGVLAGTVLGPWAGAVALTLVLVVQWALFSDGGLTALGANVLHMAVLGSIGGYALVSTLRSVFSKTPRSTILTSALAAWISVMAASALFCLEFHWSHRTENLDSGRIFALMMTFHAVIGIGEALITGSIISVLLKQRPDLLYSPQNPQASSAPIARFTTAILLTTFLIAAIAAPFASSAPDGLEAVAERTSFPEPQQIVTGIFPDYADLPFGRWQYFSVTAAGLSGSLIVLGVALTLGRFLSRKKPAEFPA